MFPFMALKTIQLVYCYRQKRKIYTYGKLTKNTTDVFMVVSRVFLSNKQKYGCV